MFNLPAELGRRVGTILCHTMLLLYYTTLMLYYDMFILMRILILTLTLTLILILNHYIPLHYYDYAPRPLSLRAGLDGLGGWDTNTNTI